MKTNQVWKVLAGIIVFASFVTCCDNKEYDRDKGPSDIRIENMTSRVFDSIFVDTSGGENSYPSLNPGGQSEYKRFEFAYPQADISVYINSVEYTHGPVNYTYAVWLGKGKFTYQLDIADTVNYTLSIKVTADAPLD